MNWYWVIEHVLALHIAFGAYCGYVWTRKDVDGDQWSIPMALTVGCILGVFIWPFYISAEGAPMPAKKTIQSKAARAERTRMARELAAERGQVAMIEASAHHRQEMAKLGERRRQAEELT